MAAFIPALLGLGTSLAGGIGELAQRRGARAELERSPLASRQIAEANARNLQRQALAQRTTNPMAAVRNAAQLGQQARLEGNLAAAREQAVRNQLVSQMRQSEASQLSQFLGGVGGAGAAIGAQLIGSEPDADAVTQIGQGGGPQFTMGAAPGAPPQAPTQAGGVDPALLQTLNQVAPAEPLSMQQQDELVNPQAATRQQLMTPGTSMQPTGPVLSEEEKENRRRRSGGIGSFMGRLGRRGGGRG